MDRRCPQNVYIGIGLLQDWRWIICQRGYANIVPSKGDVVYGLMYEINPEDEATLDRYEGVPTSYEKKMLTIEHLSVGGKIFKEKTLEVLVYVNDTLKTESRPVTEYIYRMNMGIKDAIAEGVPQDHINKYLRPFIPEE